MDQKGARYITDTLWALMESGTEEVKILQSVILLLTTNTVVHGETLARVRNLNHVNSVYFIKSFDVFILPSKIKTLFLCLYRLWYYVFAFILLKIQQS